MSSCNKEPQLLRGTHQYKFPTLISCHHATKNHSYANIMKDYYQSVWWRTETSSSSYRWKSSLSQSFPFWQIQGYIYYIKIIFFPTPYLEKSFFSQFSGVQRAFFTFFSCFPPFSICGWYIYYIKIKGSTNRAFVSEQILLELNLFLLCI